MKELEEINRKFKIAHPKKLKEPRIWREKEILNGEIVDSFVIILRTRGCKWAGCSMCGYFRETYPASGEEIKRQLDTAYKNYRGEDVVKFFTSGSFLDENEIPPEVRNYAIEKFSKAKRIIFETRPEFVDALEEFKEKEKMEVAMGLESANDRVLEYSINKGFNYREWREAAEKVRMYGMNLRVYVLIKPPFLTEKEAIMDVLETVKKVGDIANTISFNPVAIHGKTLVEFLWKRNLYRPPWLWSVVEILKESRQMFNGIIRCDVVAGGKERGSHNCGKCDKKIMERIRNFTLTQNVRHFENLNCECMEEWQDLLEIERFI